MPLIATWTEAELNGLGFRWGLSRILAEVSESGKVSRELGFDDQGNVVHRYPSEPTVARFGVFDLAEIKQPEYPDLGNDEFERLWSA